MQTITLPVRKYEELVSKLEHLSQEMEKIKRLLLKKEPAYGSDHWWKWSDEKAKADINSGKVVKFDSAEEAIKWLNS